MFHVRDRHHDARMGLRTAPESTDSALRKRSRASASIRRYVSPKYESDNDSPPRQVGPLSSLEACHSVVSSPGLRPQYGKLARCLTMRPHEFSDRGVIQAQDGAVRAHAHCTRNERSGSPARSVSDAELTSSTEVWREPTKSEQSAHKDHRIVVGTDLRHAREAIRHGL